MYYTLYHNSVPIEDITSLDTLCLIYYYIREYFDKNPFSDAIFTIRNENYTLCRYNSTDLPLNYDEM